MTTGDMRMSDDAGVDLVRAGAAGGEALCTMFLHVCTSHFTRSRVFFGISVSSLLSSQSFSSRTPSAEEADVGGARLNGFVNIPPAFCICMHGNTLHMLVSAVASVWNFGLSMEQIIMI